MSTNGHKIIHRTLLHIANPIVVGKDLADDNDNLTVLKSKSYILIMV